MRLQERIRRNDGLAERLAGAAPDTITAFCCECRHLLCSDAAVLRLDEFAAARQRATLVCSVQHGVLPGDVEIVHATGRYVEVRLR
jgi:hypothetical protein